MRNPLAFWIALRSGLWFVPTVVVLVSMATAHVLVEAGARIPALAQAQLPGIFGFSAEGSRSMLSAIATSIITIAGVAFSITVVTLSLASSQYSPRVLRQFMRDRVSQWVLGVFVGVFAFCLTVVPRVRSGGSEGFVPALAVAGAIVYALVGVGCLILFIHHVATSIQASSIVAAIAEETRAVARTLFADESDGSPNEAAAFEESGPWHAIPAPDSGYIQLFDHSCLLAVAAKHDVVLRMERGVGEFVVAGTPLLLVAGAGAQEPELVEAAHDAVTINRARTIEQDVMSGARQIVDVALRALSPSLNDPTTATLCVDYLTTILYPLADRPMGKRLWRHEGRVHLIERRPDFTELLSLAYGEIRASAGSQVLVLQGIIRGLELLASVVRDPARRKAMATEAKALHAALDRQQCEPSAAPICAQADRLWRRLEG